MLEILNKLNNLIKELPSELVDDTDQIDINKLKEFSNKKSKEAINSQVLKNSKNNKKINIDSKISNRIYLNDLGNNFGLNQKIKNFLNLKKGDILLLSSTKKKEISFYVIFNQHIDDDYFSGVPVDESGKLGSEVSSFYDQTNIEGLLSNNLNGIIGLNEMEISFHKSSIVGYAGKIKDISKSELFNYYEEKSMSSIEKLNDKRITPRAKFYECVLALSEFENKKYKEDEIKDLIHA